MQNISKENQDIFNYIATLIVAEDFKNAQVEFFDKNCSNFEQEDENKHIYQTIYKEYADILDKSIESQLLEKFPESQITKFFESFADDYKLYSDQDTVETLFTFTDFENFKKTMVDYNLRITNKKIEDYDEPAGQNKFSQSAYDEIFNTPIGKFKQVLKGKTEEDLSVYSIKFGNSGLDMIRSHIYIKDCTVQAVTDKMINMNMEDYLKKSKEIKEAKYIKKEGPNSNYSYFVYSMPMMSDREYLTHNRYIQKGGQHIISITPVELPEVPITKKYIRAEFHQTAYVEEVPGKRDVKIVSLEVYDMKGYVPKMFMNMMLTKMAKQQIQMFIDDVKAKQAELDGKK